MRRKVSLARRRTLVAARPSWVSGAARLVDLGGTFDRYFIGHLPPRNGEAALARDWEQVGSDIASAMHLVDPENAE